MSLKHKIHHYLKTRQHTPYLMKMLGTSPTKGLFLFRGTKRPIKGFDITGRIIRAGEIKMVNEENKKDNDLINIKLEEMISITIKVQICMYVSKNLMLSKIKKSISDLTDSKIEEMLNDALKRVESIDNGVKDLKCDVSNLSQTIISHSTSYNQALKNPNKSLIGSNKSRSQRCIHK